jgi:hypothetical protein
MEKIFTNIYENLIWGSNNNPEYRGSSGDGSDVQVNLPEYIPCLKNFIIGNNIKSVVDLGCGDFRCGPYIYNDLDISYTGYDVYKKVVDFNAKQFPEFQFLHLDFYNKKEEIIDGDLYILKDVLQHWTVEQIYTFLDYLVENKKFKYILICNCSSQTIDNPSHGINSWPFIHLSVEFFPLKKYNPIKIMNYSTKEISIIPFSKNNE